MDFLQRPPPETMLVRGLAGTGKSTFALTLLSAFPGRKVYVTSRVSSRELHRDFPWLGENGSAGVSVVDASRRSSTLRETARALQKVNELLVDGNGTGEAASLWMPSPLQEAWSLSRSDEPTMVVIDSWDAVVEKYLGVPASLNDGLPDRAEMERLVLDQLNRGPLHTVLILEREEASQLDYLVNGVLSTERITVDGRAERWLHLLKLRGVRLDNATYPFTLEKGRFQCITPIQPDFVPRLRPPDPEPEARPGYLWPGSMDYAAAFGRLSLGHVSLFETEQGVLEGAIRLVFAPIVAQVIQGGGRVFHILAPQISPREVWKLYEPLVSRETFRRQVRIQSPAGLDTDEPELEGVMVPLPTSTESGTHTRSPEALQFLREGSKTGAPNLSIVWVAGLNALGAVTGTRYRPETLPSLVLEWASGTNIHEIFVGVGGDPLVESVRSMASVRLRFGSRGGRVFVYGTQPVTPPFVLVEGDCRKTYGLLRVV
jgi:KaiC/GvpD/RAD55 family RecA-like ATPase